MAPAGCPHMNLLMLSGDRTLASGEHGPFRGMLEEFASYWDRIDILCPRVPGVRSKQVLSKVWVHPSPRGRSFQPTYIGARGRELLAERPYGLLVSHDYGLFYNALGAALLKRRRSLPWISEVHHVDGLPRADGWRHGFKARAAYRYVRWARSRVNGFRTVCRQVSELLERWGVESAKLMLLPSLYIDLAAFTASNAGHKDVDLLYCARLERGKGIRLFLDAVRVVKRARPDLRVLIVGRGPMRSVVTKAIRHYDLQRNVQVVDWLPGPAEVAAVYRRSRILVCTSFSEGNPRVVGEALASGIAVVSTPVGIVPELVKNGENGMIADWDAEDLARQIAKLLDDRELYRRICSQAGAAVQAYEARTIIRRLALAYREVAARA